MSEGDPFDTKINSLAGSSADNVMETTEDEESVKTNDDDSFNNSNQISDIPQLTGTSGTDLPLGVIMDVPDVSVKKFIFRSKSKVPGSSEYDTLSILVPEVKIRNWSIKYCKLKNRSSNYETSLLYFRECKPATVCMSGQVLQYSRGTYTNTDILYLESV